LIINYYYFVDNLGEYLVKIKEVIKQIDENARVFLFWLSG